MLTPVCVVCGAALAAPGSAISAAKAMADTVARSLDIDTSKVPLGLHRPTYLTFGTARGFERGKAAQAQSNRASAPHPAAVHPRHDHGAARAMLDDQAVDAFAMRVRAGIFHVVGRRIRRVVMPVRIERPDPK